MCSITALLNSFNHSCLSRSKVVPSSGWILLDDLSPLSILLNELSLEIDPLRLWGELTPAPSEEVPSMHKETMEPERSRGDAVGGGAAGCPAGSGGAVGCASARQTGQVEWEVSHLSMHSAWKVCLQFGSSLTTSSSSNKLRQTVHSEMMTVFSSRAVGSGCRKTNVGRDAMTEGSSPVFGGDSEDWLARATKAKLCKAALLRAWRRRSHLA